MTFEELGIKTQPGKVRYSTQCPQCNGSRQKHKNAPCLTVNDEPGNRWFLCHHCSWSGNLDIMDKYKEVQEKSKMPKQIPEIYSQEVMEYWKRRGIDHKICVKEKIFEYTLGRKPILGFPVYIAQTLVNVKYLNIRWQPGDDGPKWWQLNKEIGTKIMPWGLQSLRFNQDEPKIIIWTEGECFTGDTEVLTRNGWIKFSEYNGGDVMQVHYGENFVGSFVSPIGITKSVSDELIKLNSKNYSSLTTLGHNIVLKARHSRKIKKEFAGVVGRTIYSDVIPLTVKSVIGNEGLLFSDDELRLIVAISADMTLRKTGDIYGAFKKDRKKIRLLEILSQLNIPCSCTKDKRNYWSIFINRKFVSKYLIKEFPHSWIGQLNHHQIGVILDEILYWDGNSVPNRNQIEYSSKLYSNATFIQTLSHLYGYGSTIIRRSNQIGSWYKVSILFKKDHVCADGNLKRERIKLRSPAKVYCVTVPSGMLLVRHNEKISISGNCDRLTWLSAGYKNVLSEPQGAPSVESKDFKDKFAYADDPYFKSVIADVEQIIFSTDGDEPGRVLRNHLALLFGKERCKYINYPSGYKDINEVWKGDVKKNLPALGQEGVDECYRNVSSFPVKGIIRYMDVKDEMDVIAKKGYTPGLKIGFKEIDDLYTIKPKRNQFFIGLPGSGKSTYVRWHVTELIRNNPALELKFALFTPENRPVSRERAKIAEVITGKSYQDGYPNSMNDMLRDRTNIFIDKHFFFLSPDKKNFESWNNEISSEKVNSLQSIMKYLIYLKKTENIFGYIIDAWNKIDHEQPKNMSETTFISKALDYLIDFNDYYDLHGIVVVHPTKIEKVGINYRMPNLYDAKGSSAWKEKADVGIIGHRYMLKKKQNHEIPEDATDDEKYTVDYNAPFILHTEKIRFEEEGRSGMVKLQMNRAEGGRFKLYKKEEEKKENPYDIPNKLNPKVKDDDVFGDSKRDDRDLPF